jgi:type I restriction-modification system DNA methylase subunit
VDVFRDWPDIPGFSRAVSLQEIADNGFNLSVRRYVDTGMPAGPPLDARAIISGGMPRREVVRDTAPDKQRSHLSRPREWPLTCGYRARSEGLEPPTF